MEVMNVVVPNAPAGSQSSASGNPVTSGSPAIAKGASLATAGLVAADTTVKAIPIDSAAAGLLFGMVLAQLAVVKEAGIKEADTEVADVSQTQSQPSPDQISMLASLVPALVTLPVAPPTIAVVRETPAAVLSGSPRTGILTLPVELNAIGGAVESVLPTDQGTDFKTGQLHNQGLARDLTLPGTAQMPVATVTQTPSVILPATLPKDQAQSVQTALTPVSSAPETDNQSVTPSANNAALNAAALSAIANSSKSERSPAAPPPSLLIDAIPVNKGTSGNDLLKGILEDNNGTVFELVPAAGDKIPNEFLAGRSPTLAPLTELTEPQATAAPTAPAAPAMIPPRETLRFELGASDLGRLTVQVSVQSQQVQATVGVEHRGLGEFLAAGHVALDQALRQHGLRLDELHVQSLPNPDMLGSGDGRTGFLDHGQSRQDEPGFMREAQANHGPESEAIMAKVDHILEPLSGRYRINLFA